VGNFTESDGRTVDSNRLPLYVFGDTSNLVNNTPLDTGFLRTKYGKYPGMGSINVFTPKLYPETLKYNAMQLSVERRLSRGLQVGLAYTLAKGELSGYDPHRRYRRRCGDPSVASRRTSTGADNLVALQLRHPESHADHQRTARARPPQVSGVTKFLTGTTRLSAARATTAASRTPIPRSPGVTARRYHGQPIDSGFTDTTLPEPDQLHFNPAAFAMAQPLSATVGNFGDAPLGLFRHPSWSSWDVTLARRIPISVGRGATLRIQIQAYNIFNQVQFTNLDTSFTFTGTNNSTNNNSTTAKYSAPTTGANAGGTIPPRQLGLTLRLD
jgi:hypothetical protein